MYVNGGLENQIYLAGGGITLPIERRIATETGQGPKARYRLEKVKAVDGFRHSSHQGNRFVFPYDKAFSAPLLQIKGVEQYMNKTQRDLPET